MQRNSGFTLIEIIVSLMLVSLLATVAGFGLVEVARGYQAARENGRMAQAAQIALLRIGRELMELETVDNSNGSEIVVTRPGGNQTAMGLSGTDILVDDDATVAGGEILIRGVSSFEIGYKDLDDQDWVQGTDDMDQLARIDIRLELSRNDGMTAAPFTTSINPRNNGAPNAPY
jgi:prepilin-type N-terminal cleavage/methylation domain-containing protein